jgi:hypothetical protein
MNQSRRSFLGQSGQIAAAGMAGILAAGCAESAQQGAAPSEAEPAPGTPEPETPAAETPEPMMVAACGLACTACPLMKAEKCKGCAAKAEMAKSKGMEPCPVFQCAAMKKIDYCGTGCMKFAECEKLIGRPYAQSFMDMMKTRMADSA